MNNYEKVEKLLEDYAELDINIKGLELDIKEEGLKGVSYNDMPGSPLPSNRSPVEIGLNNIEKLKREKITLEIRKEKIENILMILDDRERTLIDLKYIKKLSNQQIAKQLYMHENSVSNKKKTILMKLEPYAIKRKLI